MIIDKRGRGTFPEEVRRDLGLDADRGNLVFLQKTRHGTYELVPAALVRNDQLWFRHPEMQQRVEQAEGDFREGRSTAAGSIEAAQALLDQLKG